MAKGFWPTTNDQRLAAMSNFLQTVKDRVVIYDGAFDHRFLLEAKQSTSGIVVHPPGAKYFVV
jgi:hypothetical protein